jgi:hypothetical protein
MVDGRLTRCHCVNDIPPEQRAARRQVLGLLKLTNQLAVAVYKKRASPHSRLDPLINQIISWA